MKNNQNQATNELDTLGKRLQHLRNQLGLTQAELAELLNVNESTISRTENDKMGLQCSALPRLCELLHTTADFIALGVTNDTATSRDLSCVPSDALLKELAKRLKTC